MIDNPVSPSHYKNNGWEAFEVREAVLLQMIEAGCNPVAAANVYEALKYLLRVGRKDSAKQELEKAEVYLRRAINFSVQRVE